MQPLAPADQTQLKSSTNLSTTLSLTILDPNSKEISVETLANQSFELFIPRDPNLTVPPMTLISVTAMNLDRHRQLFNLHSVALPKGQWNNNRTVALVIEMHPLNTSHGYLFIYRFDTAPQLTGSVQQIDGWSLFCPSSELSLILCHCLSSLYLDLTNTNIHRYFLNNLQTAGRQSIVFGLRELNSTELDHYCSNQSFNTPPIPVEPFNFTSNYQLRSYTACCYYLDEKNVWQTKGLVVSCSSIFNSL